MILDSNLRRSLSLWSPIFMILVTALAVYFVPGDSFPLVYFRWIVGTIFTLILPGYVLADAFYDIEKVKFIEKLMLGFAFSVIIIGSLGYLLNQLPWGISTSSIFVSLSLGTFGVVLTRIFRMKHQATVSQRDQVPPKARGIQPRYIVLASIVVLGTIVKSIPYMRIDAFLDLDPYNHFMKVNAILDEGRIPSFDPLSLAPKGTSATYTITPLGFELLVVALEIMTQAPQIKLMGLLPVLYGALTILAMFFLCYETTESAIASLFAAFFTAFSTSWLLIYGASMNPLAECVGLYLFPLALLFLAKHVKALNKSYIIFSGILFATMFYVHLFTVIYFVLTLMGYAVISFLIKKRTKYILKAVIYIFVLGSLLSLPILFQVAPASIQAGFAFSRMALELAFASGSYLTLTLEDLPRLLSFPVLYLAIITLSATVLRIAGPMLGKRYKVYDGNLLSASWCFSLLLASFVHLIKPLRDVLAVIPFSGPFLYTHRVVPYLTLSFYMLAAVAIGNYVLPFIKVFKPTLKFRSKNIRLGILMILVITTSMTVSLSVISVRYTDELASQYTSQTYTNFFAWVKENTGGSDVFIANNWDVSMWLRAVGKRPTVFSHVHQDLVSSDAGKRMQLHSVVFCDNFYDEAVQLLSEYDVSYVIVTAEPIYFDIMNKKWIQAIPDLDGYIEEMDSIGYLKRVFSADDIWVYSVNKNVTTYLYRLNVTNKRKFIGNGWSLPYYLNGVLSRNATRGYVTEWRFSDFFVSIDPERKEYVLEIEYYDIKSSNPVVDLFAYTQNGTVKIGNIYLNGTLTFKTATFNVPKDFFFDYYSEVAGFQQYFVIGDLSVFDLPISHIMIQEVA